MKSEVFYVSFKPEGTYMPQDLFFFFSLYQLIILLIYFYFFTFPGKHLLLASLLYLV